MPRMISFALTTAQFVDGSKDVTRRDAWLNLKAGDVLMAVEKAMGLGKGGKVKRLGLIRVKDVRREPLRRMIDEPDYGRAEVVREGFPQMTAKGFVEFYSNANRRDPHTAIVTRIEFEKVKFDCYWVGLETAGSPHGHGEDYREYVAVPAGDDPSEKLHAAVLRWANYITSWDDGSRIAVRKVP